MVKWGGRADGEGGWWGERVREVMGGDPLGQAAPFSLLFSGFPVHLFSHHFRLSLPFSSHFVHLFRYINMLQKREKKVRTEGIQFHAGLKCVTFLLHRFSRS